MELNEIIDRKLTSEQKSRFQSDNGKFKLLKNITMGKTMPLIAKY